MAKQKKTPAVIGLHFVPKRDGDYIHFGLYPVVIGRTPEELTAMDRAIMENREVQPCPSDRVRNVSCQYDWDTINGLDLSGLRIWSQGHKGTDRLYGWETEYHDVHAVDRSRAVRMAKTLTAIKTRMEKYADKVGSPATFGQYVAAVAKAIGATKLVFVKNQDTLRGWSWNDVDVTIRDFPKEAISHIDWHVNRWLEETKKETVAS